MVRLLLTDSTQPWNALAFAVIGTAMNFGLILATLQLYT